MSAEWVDVCGVDDIEPEDVIRIDLDDHTLAVYRTADDQYFATDGLCTHARVHLADGFVSGTTIECPKHNGRFDIVTGAAKGAPACVELGTHPVRVIDGRVGVLLQPSA
jgi:3-phenylpropionate/trans-cinnamate dioxygenase ferredoxin component